MFYICARLGGDWNKEGPNRFKKVWKIHFWSFFDFLTPWLSLKSFKTFNPQLHDHTFEAFQDQICWWSSSPFSTDFPWNLTNHRFLGFFSDKKICVKSFDGDWNYVGPQRFRKVKGHLQPYFDFLTPLVCTNVLQKF